MVAYLVKILSLHSKFASSRGFQSVVATPPFKPSRESRHRETLTGQKQREELRKKASVNYYNELIVHVQKGRGKLMSILSLE